MRGPSSIPARRLHQRRVRLRQEELRRASLFPFFDLRGEVKRVMLVWSKSPQILLLEHWPGRFQVPTWGALQVDADLDFEDDLSLHRTDEVAGLRHYDPWWRLSEPRYQDHPLTPILKKTNCAKQAAREPRFNADLGCLETPVVPEPKERNDLTPGPSSTSSQETEPCALDRRSSWRLRTHWPRVWCPRKGSVPR